MPNFGLNKVQETTMIVKADPLLPLPLPKSFFFPPCTFPLPFAKPSLTLPLHRIPLSYTLTPPLSSPSLPLPLRQAPSPLSLFPDLVMPSALASLNNLRSHTLLVIAPPSSISLFPLPLILYRYETI